jgi:hypothetical protein
MRLTDYTKFPHPVLGPFTGDYLEGEFSVEFEVSENLKSGSLSLRYSAVLTHPDIEGLITGGGAVLGCLVRCGDTFYNELRTCSYPHGSIDFLPGALLNKVTLRPVVWLADDLQEWSPEALHSEFPSPITMRFGDIVAVGAASEISVGQAKLASIESIFELNKSLELEEGEICVDLEGDRVSILVAPGVFCIIELLREQELGFPVVMNSVYLPAVMEVLDRLQEDLSSYRERRWFLPFKERCRDKGVEHEVGASILEGAQKLLDLPALKLSELVKGD